MRIDEQITIEQLAALPQLEYEKIREKAAKQFNVRVTALDKEVLNIQKSNSSKTSLIFPEIKEWPEKIDLSDLLEELVTTIKRFIVCNDETAIATALWCAFTWVIDHVQVAPIAVITAPEKRCGKSQLLNIIRLLSKNPLIASNITPAAMFRVIEAHKPTLLIDEADTFLKANDELRGVINSGHTRQSAYVIRTVGDTHEPTKFSTWGAKALCGIGSVPSTIQDRAIMLEMRRKLTGEKVERIRYAEPNLFGNYQSKLARFAKDANDVIKNAKPALPDELNDRAQDNWEPIFAIADYAGGKWSDLARKTALHISGLENESTSLSTELLEDIKDIFDGKNLNRIRSTKLIDYLIENDESPWATYNRGKPIAPRQLSKRLKEYNIKSKDMRFFDGVGKGYEKSQFEDVFNRYLNHSSQGSSISETKQQNSVKADNTKGNSVASINVSSATHNTNATDSSHVITNLSEECCVVADNPTYIVEVEI